MTINIILLLNTTYSCVIKVLLILSLLKLIIFCYSLQNQPRRPLKYPPINPQEQKKECF